MIDSFYIIELAAKIILWCSDFLLVIPRTQLYKYRDLYIEIFFKLVSEQNDDVNLLSSAGVFGIFFYISNLPWPEYSCLMRNTAEILAFFSSACYNLEREPLSFREHCLLFEHLFPSYWTGLSSEAFGCGKSVLVLHAKIILATVLLSLIFTSKAAKPKAETASFYLEQSINIYLVRISSIIYRILACEQMSLIKYFSLNHLGK